MKKWLHNDLACPECFSNKNLLDLIVKEEVDDDVMEGRLVCTDCGAQFEISGGVAILLPKKTRHILSETSGYNSQSMLSAYLWSHFSEFFNGPNATEAYTIWSSLFDGKNGYAVDIGCAVGRLSFDLSRTHSRVIGLDTSLSFIKRARRIMKERSLHFDMILEGNITERQVCELNPDWNFDRVEFVVADALALPFHEDLFSTASSINILEKVPHPIQHLQDVNRVLKKKDSVFVFSDPFSWDASVSTPDLWLGGRNQGPFQGRGVDNMERLLSNGDGVFTPPFEVSKKGDVLWKIRKTENLWEYIHSQYLIGVR
ncbi:Methyltransferase type 11 [Desulfatibacillum aliphaticivorans]|uniref:Methyltransferase type 11 n=1 Tax=Desulfatibacillum aliphaticivorans TaxID=218208 RepID=B8FMR7_DESAL|nr:methyltransferase domain-containing protein [Desulfatibacillum aliphaticivorans]ACL01934.1 Methyltransferase type 11 [Desulfatibacillum aliphaticivorans]